MLPCQNLLQIIDAAPRSIVWTIVSGKIARLYDRKEGAALRETVLALRAAMNTENLTRLRLIALKTRYGIHTEITI